MAKVSQKPFLKGLAPFTFFRGRYHEQSIKMAMRYLKIFVLSCQIRINGNKIKMYPFMAKVSPKPFFKGLTPFSILGGRSHDKIVKDGRVIPQNLRLVKPN